MLFFMTSNFLIEYSKLQLIKKCAMTFIHGIPCTDEDEDEKIFIPLKVVSKLSQYLLNRIKTGNISTCIALKNRVSFLQLSSDNI